MYMIIYTCLCVRVNVHHTCLHIFVFTELLEVRLDSPEERRELLQAASLQLQCSLAE